MIRGRGAPGRRQGATHPIDRAARDTAALALRRFAANRLTNDEFDDRYPAHTSDAAVRAIGLRAWTLYSDLHQHRLDAGPELRREIARWVLFLRTDLEYHWPPLPLVWIRAPRWLDWLSGGRLHRRQHDAFARWSARGDVSVWPFRHAHELAAVCARPLAGQP